MATSDGTFGEIRFDQSDQSFVDASQPLEQSLRDAEAALEAAICAIKVGQPAPIKQVDEKVKAVWRAWMNLDGAEADSCRASLRRKASSRILLSVKSADLTPAS